jgi:outer membrane protein
MKRIVSILILLNVSIITGWDLLAQNLKFGHVNREEFIKRLPEFDSAQVKLEKFRKELINHIELMSIELNSKYNDYTKSSKTLSELVKQNKEQELEDMNRRIQEFQTNAQTQLQEKQAELFQPILSKVDKAIKDVGKQNGYLYIFDVSQGSMLQYFNESISTDVTDLLRIKLKSKQIN